MICLFCIIQLVSIDAQQVMILTDKGEDYYESINLPLLSGEVSHPTAEFLSLQLIHNFITFEKKVYKAYINHDGSFRFNIDLDQPTAALLFYNGERIELFLEPEKELFATFSGKSFIHTLTFSGQGGEQNTYLKESLLNFTTYDQDFVQFEMEQRGAMAFRQFMDGLYQEKLDFFNSYSSLRKEHFSPAFQAFAKANMDYWRAYYLMNYRKDYPAAHGLNVPMTLPAQYYDFLQAIELSNDASLTNKYYVYFLDTFFDFVKENPSELTLLEGCEADLLVQKDCTGYLNGPMGFPIPTRFKKGEGLKLISEGHPLVGEQKLSPWYQVQLEDETQAWINSANIKAHAFPSQEMDYTAYREVEQYSSHVEVYGINRYDNLQVRKDPYAETYFASLDEGVEVDFLYNRTKEMISYKYDTLIYKDYFIKIKTSSGQPGWVLKGAIDLKERVKEVVTTKQVPISITPLVYNNAEKYLNNKAKYYILAKDIYGRASDEEQEQLKKEVTDFLELCEVEDYKTIVQEAYNNSIKGKQNTHKLVALHQLEAGFNRANLPLEEELETAETVNGFSYTPASEAVNASLILSYANIDSKPAPRTKYVTHIKGTQAALGSHDLVLVLSSDPVLDNEMMYPLHPNNEGLVTQDLKLVEPVIGELRYGEQVARVYLEPGDDLSFTFHPENFLTSLEFTGKGSAHNNYLKTFATTFSKTENELKMNTRFSEFPAFLNYMDGAHEVQLAFFHNFELKDDFSERFNRFAQADIDYWRAFYLLNYPWEHPLYHDKKAPMDVPTEYYNFLNEVEINATQALPNKYYTYFLEQYITYQAGQAAQKELDKTEVAKKFLENEALHFYQAKLLASECRRGKIREAGWKIESFLEECSYETYNDVLRYVYNEKKALVKGSIAPDFDLADISGEAVSLNDYAGKVVYIDFWATWCAPCLRSMQNSQKLLHQYQEEDIVFLYISLDKDKAAWESYVKTNELAGEHIIAKGGSGFLSQIAKLYKVKQLPAYFLVDKDGKIAYDKAGSPGSSMAKEQINRLLIQN